MRRSGKHGIRCARCGIASGERTGRSSPDPRSYVSTLEQYVATDDGKPPAAPKHWQTFLSSVRLLEFDRCARVFQLFLVLLSLLFGGPLFNSGRRALDEFLSLFQTHRCHRTDRFNNSHFFLAEAQ